jgi:hypothetical protein
MDICLRVTEIQSRPPEEGPCTEREDSAGFRRLHYTAEGAIEIKQAE